MMRHAVAAMAALSLLSACASHRIYVPNFDAVGAAGEAVEVGDLSIAGRKGATTGHSEDVARYCGNANLTSVEVRKNVLQSLVSALTFGVVSPAKILFYCAKEPIDAQ